MIFTTRYKVIFLFLLNIGIILIPKSDTLAFLALILLFNVIFFKTLVSNIKTLMIYVLGLFIVSIILNCLLAGNNIADSAIDILKIFAIINISILLIQDINIMELVAFLSKIRIPTKIAIALGVGIRYFSLLTYDVKRINFVQSINGYGFNMRKIKKNGFIKTISIFLTPLFLNILKRTENISISVSIQNVENRAKGFQFKRTTIPEYMVLTISLAVLLYGIYSSLFH